MLILVVSFRGQVFSIKRTLDNRLRLASMIMNLLMIITKMITIRIIWMRITNIAGLLKKLKMLSKVIMTLNRTR